ncbi:MAG TPA: DUF3343 domain-containing protein [Proteobacteria bacterium]|nr:DUF3343 domain-containing protein [Pseudomonadota bacterium]
MNPASKMDLRLIFHSIHNVMLAEELLLQDGLAIDMQPVPRVISSDCGMCLAARSVDLPRIKVCLAKAPFTSPIEIYQSPTADDHQIPRFERLSTL